MRALGFIGIAALSVFNAIGFALSARGGDWVGMALMLVMAIALGVLATALRRGGKFEREANSNRKLASGWYGESVSAFFANQVARTPEGLVLIVGSATCLVFAALALATPSLIGLAEGRVAGTAALFGTWPILALVAYVYICGPAFRASMYTPVAMLCVVAAPIFITYW